MPIYEYRCSDCGHRLEALQRLADAPLIECPACRKKSLVKLMSAVGFQLKGSGWYATDFKHAGSKPADKATAKSGDDGKSGEGASNDAKGQAAPSSTEKSDTKPAAQPASSDGKTASTDSKASAAAPAKPAATGS